MVGKGGLQRVGRGKENKEEGKGNGGRERDRRKTGGERRSASWNNGDDRGGRSMRRGMATRQAGVAAAAARG